MATKFNLDGYRLSRHAAIRLHERTKLSEEELYDLVQAPGSVHYVGFAHDFGEFNTSVRFFVFFSPADYKHFIIVSDVNTKVIITVLHLHFFTEKYGEIENSILHSSRRAGIDIRRDLIRKFLISNNANTTFYDTKPSAVQTMEIMVDNNQPEKSQVQFEIFANYIEFAQDFTKIPMRRKLFRVDNNQYQNVCEMLDHNEFKELVRKKLMEFDIKHLDFCKIEVMIKKKQPKVLANIDANIFLNVS